MECATTKRGSTTVDDHTNPLVDALFGELENSAGATKALAIIATWREELEDDPGTHLHYGARCVGQFEVVLDLVEYGALCRQQDEQQLAILRTRR